MHPLFSCMFLRHARPWFPSDPRVFGQSGCAYTKRYLEDKIPIKGRQFYHSCGENPVVAKVDDKNKTLVICGSDLTSIYAPE